jgi:hypothetical protein
MESDMNLETSVKIVDAYAKSKNITALDALKELDHLVMDDWINTRPGAPKGYQRKTTLAQDEAITVFCQNRYPWRTEAVKQGVDISNFD